MKVSCYIQDKLNQSIVNFNKNHFPMKRMNLVTRGFTILIVVSLTIACMNDNMEQSFETQLDRQDEISQSSFDLFEDEVGQYLRMNPSMQNQLIAKIRQATVKYHDQEVAIADGYELHPCVQHPTLGGMGHHAVNMEIIMAGFDPFEPSVLVYEPMQNGKLKLVALEYIIPSTPLFGDEVDELDPPMLGNIPFDNHRRGQMVNAMDENGNPIEIFQPDRGGPPMPHYQLHVWLWKHNPAGMYIPFNPTVNCDYAQ